MERYLTKGVASMALFTNRKHQDTNSDIVHSGRAISALTPAVDVIESDPIESAFDDTTGLPDQRAAAELADFGITLEDVEPDVPPRPRRTLAELSAEEATLGKVRQTNVEIDVDGLLEVLGVDADASLVDISQARLEFLSQHDPSVETNEDAAKIKERICREVNIAYASFRLSQAGSIRPS